MKIPSPECLRELLSYNPETGLLTWRVRPINHFPDERAWKSWNTRYSGKITRSMDGLGYIRVNIKGTPFMAHRICWSIYYGSLPDTIDHINLDPSDNRIVNLRECTMSQNQHNRAKNKNNKSGFKNVCLDANNKWRAYIVKDYKQKHIGSFDTPELAYAAYCKEASKFHGEFTNLG
jgi:hypothetical protein